MLTSAIYGGILGIALAAALNWLSLSFELVPAWVLWLSLCSFGIAFGIANKCKNYRPLIANAAVAAALVWITPFMASYSEVGSAESLARLYNIWSALPIVLASWQL